ncbi:MAG: hypothetical protein E7214_00670 [Clostridium sp.]|nr:hypothetical protein [Clostridium sp.]
MKNNTILDFIKQWGKEAPNKKAYNFLQDNEDNNVCVTFKELYEGIIRYASCLQEKGVKKGDRIIIFGEQSIETIYSIYGTLMVGAIFVIVPTPVDKSKQERFIFAAKSSEAKYVFCKKKILEEINIDTKIPVIDVLEIRNEGTYNFVEEDIDEEDIAALQYTSGSINEPKGIMWTHKNIIESMKSLSKYNPEGNTFVTWLPFFHSMGLLTGVLLNVYVGNTNVILTTDRFVSNPLEWLVKISEYRSSMVWAPNSAYITCANLVSKGKYLNLDLSNVKCMINCSESINSSDWEKIASAFGSYGLSEDVLQGQYGLTEATGEVSGGPVYNLDVDGRKLQENIIEIANSRTKEVKTLSGVGKIIDSVKVLIVNPETLKKCNNNEVGEIWVKGDKIAKGYWKNKEKTKESFKAVILGEEGCFFRTGDLGCIYEDQLYILGRMKEVVIVNGHNIYLRDIEINLKKEIIELEDAVVYSFSVNIDNKEQIIVGVEGSFDSKFGKIAKEIKIVFHRYFGIDPYDILILPPEKLIRTDNGKFALGKNRKAYLSNDLEILYSCKRARTNKKNTNFTTKGLEIKTIFEEVLDVKCNYVEDDFFDLGGDSLKTVVLVKQLSEHFKIKIDSDDLVDYRTIKDIEKLIEIKQGKIQVDNNIETSEEFSEQERLEREYRISEANKHINSDIEITTVEMYYPENKVSVDEIIEDYKGDKEEIRSVIKNYLGKDILYKSDDEKENSLTMAYKVVEKALKSANLKGKDIDMIVFSCTTPEYTVPPMSLLIHHKINGKKDAICFDMNVNCAGMTTAMTGIYRTMESDPYVKRTLLVGSEFSSIHMSSDNYRMRANLSDAACAVIFERSKRRCGLLDLKTYINTKGIEKFAFPACGISNIYKSPIEEYYTKVGDSGWNTEKVSAVVLNLLERNHLKLEDISAFCGSQLVLFNLKLLRKNLNIPKEKVLYVGDKCGYTGTCSPFTAFHDGIKAGKIKKGDFVFFWTVASGGYYIFSIIKY